MCLLGGTESHPQCILVLKTGVETGCCSFACNLPTLDLPKYEPQAALASLRLAVLLPQRLFASIMYQDLDRIVHGSLTSLLQNVSIRISSPPEADAAVASDDAGQEPLGSTGPLAQSPEHLPAGLVAAAHSLAAPALHDGGALDACMASNELQHACPDDAGSTEQHDEEVAEAAPDDDNEPVDLLDSDEEEDDNEATDEHLSYFQ